ncbi:MAG: hypothetical protein JNL72_04630 [Flavipsychrobacter sp.]|nr:hypothetical protein [Flavipsychrobacter sp.]
MRTFKLLPTLLLLVLPIFAFSQPFGKWQLDKKVVGKWQLKKAMSAGKRSFKSEDITNRYAGNILTLYEDQTMEFYRAYDSTTFKGSYKVEQGDRHKVNPRYPQERTIYYMLDMELTSGAKTLRIDGKMLEVRKNEMEYKEYKGDLNYWFLYERVAE